MANAQINWPKKTREQQWAVWDSARLNDFKFRPDDIMISTWSKSGTTWVQQLVGQLVFKGDPAIFGQAESLWIEFRVMPKEQWFAAAEAQTHRRFLKTHSPIDAIPYLPNVKYIYVARDVRDVVWSMYHHHTSFAPGAYDVFNHAPGLVGPPLRPTKLDVKSYYNQFLDTERIEGFAPNLPYWSHVQGYWNARNLPNMLLVHYANLKRDLEGEAKRIARFLDIKVDDDLWPRIIGNCGIEHMRALAAKFPGLDIFEGGGATFINKGTNGRWRDVLSPAEIAKADEVAAKHLTQDCAHWLKTGELVE
jgi:aryl sulfotransferase